MSTLHPCRALAVQPLVGLEYSGCMPPLPDGCSAHTIWTFHGGAGRFLYEFKLVYGPSSSAGARGPIRRLDRGLSYWSVSWSEQVGGSEMSSMGRSLNFSQFRARFGSRADFTQFSSMPDMIPGPIDTLDPAGIRPSPAA